MNHLHEVELLDTMPMPARFLRPSTRFAGFAFGPDQTKLYGMLTGQSRIMEVDVASGEARQIVVDFGEPIQFQAIAIDGAHNCVIADAHNRALFFLDRAFGLIKRISFATIQLGGPLDVIGIQAGGFMACIYSQGAMTVVKFDANGVEDWRCAVGSSSRNGQPIVGPVIPFYGSADSCFLLAKFPDTTETRSMDVRVVKCEAAGCFESPVLLQLESPSEPEPGSPYGLGGASSVSFEFVGPVIAVGTDGDCLLRYGNRKCRPPVLLRYTAGEEPRVYRLPCDVLELLPFGENTFWARPFSIVPSDTLGFMFRIPAWEAGLPFSQFIAGQR